MSEPAPRTTEPTKLGAGCGIFTLAVMGCMFVTAIVAVFDNDARVVAAADFGEQWPLTVEEGTLVCSLNQVTFVHQGVEYAVNPVAQMTGLYEAIEPLRVASPPGTEVKPSLDPLIDLGIGLCDP